MYFHHFGRAKFLSSHGPAQNPSTGGQDMYRLAGRLSALFLLSTLVPAGFSQLRMHSEFVEDRINLEHTYFVLYKSGEAGFGWGSEWTEDTVQIFEDKNAMFLWHFKDGTVAYTRQGVYVGDFGMLHPYIMTEESKTLKDVHNNPVQPLTLDNYPIKIELWVGTAGDEVDFKPETRIDSVCTDQKKIEFGYAYYFYGCEEDTEP
jgi:hypothetical protein